MESAKRGPYAKGIAKRRQILQEALAAYATSDAAGPSLRSIAERVGLSERGLLHYFASRDELLVAILAERDTADRAAFDPDGALAELLAIPEHAARTPGLVRLFSDLSAAAADPSNPAHAFFVSRHHRLRSVIERMLRRDVAERRRVELPTVSPDFVARILVAASDGLQQQWLLDPSIDLKADLEKLGTLLESAVSITSPPPASPAPGEVQRTDG